MEERLRFVARLLDGEGMSHVCPGVPVDDCKNDDAENVKEEGAPQQCIDRVGKFIHRPLRLFAERPTNYGIGGNA